MFTVVTENGNYFVHCEDEDIAGIESLGFIKTENPSVFQLSAISLAMLLEECGFTADMDNFGGVPQRP